LKKLAIGVALVVGAIAALLLWDQLTFPSRKVRRETGIQRFQIRNSHFTDGDIHVNFSADESDIRAFEAKHLFVQGFTKKIAVLAGRAEPPIQDCVTCFYSFEKRPGLYEYIVYVVSEDHRLVEFYEVYSD
jgi:hypothetical protein